MIEINLLNAELKHFNEYDASVYCIINNINPDNIIELELGENEQLIDISGVKLFKNLEKLNIVINRITDISSLKNLINLKYLYMGYNKITDISSLSNLTKLESLDISNLNFTNEYKTLNILKSFKNLKELRCKNTFKIINIKKELKNIKIHI